MGKYLRSQEVLETTSSRQYNERILQVLNDWTRFADERNEELVSTAPKVVQTSQMLVWVVALVGITLSFFAALVIASSIRRPLNRLNHSMLTLENGSVTNLMKGLMAVEKGDLTVAVLPTGESIDGPSNTEIGQLEKSFNSMLAKVRAAVEAFNKTRVGLNTTVSLLQENADHVAGTSKQLTRAAQETNEAASEIVTSLQGISKLSMDQNQTLEESERSREKIFEYVNSAVDSLQKLDLAVSQVHGSAERQKNAAQLVSEAAKSGKELVVERLLNLQQIEAELKHQAEHGATMPQIEFVNTEHVESKVIELGDLAKQTNSIAMSAVYDSILKGQQGQYLGDFAERIRDVAEIQLKVAQRLTNEIQEIRPNLEKAIQAIRNVVQPGVQSKQEVIKLTQDTEIALKRIADCVETLRAATDEHHAALATVNSNIQSVKDSVNKAATPELLVNCSTSSQSLREFGRKAQGTASDIETQAKNIEEVSEVALTLTEQANELKSVANRFTVDPGAITHLTQPEDPFELAMAPPA
jgi:methyl-accepting chemotaxis protein